MSIIPLLLFTDTVIALIVRSLAINIQRKENLAVEEEIEEYVQWLNQVRGVWKNG